MNKTSISYLTHTWNPVAMKCSRLSAGCANCWHLRMADRLAKNPTISPEERSAYAGGPPVLREKELYAPMRLKKPARIGVAFMGDLFHNDVPFDFITEVLATMSLCPEHLFMVLTKRADRMKEVSEFWDKAELTCGSTWPLPNVWLGVTAENQEQADKRIPILLQTPAAKRFVSVEPMLGAVNLHTEWFCTHKACDDCGDSRCDNPDCNSRLLHLIIAGGESGPGARPMNPEWVRSLRDQCVSAGVPFFLKQMMVDGKIRKMPEIDGRTWNQWPGEERG